MSLRVTIPQLQKDLPDLLNRTVQGHDVCLIERNGQPYAVVVSFEEWQRQTVGQKLDALGPSYRVSKSDQQRTEELLAKQQSSRLTRAEQRELKELLQGSEKVLRRRAEALDRA